MKDNYASSFVRFICSLMSIFRRYCNKVLMAKLNMCAHVCNSVKPVLISSKIRAFYFYKGTDIGLGQKPDLGTRPKNWRLQYPGQKTAALILVRSISPLLSWPSSPPFFTLTKVVNRRKNVRNLKKERKAALLLRATSYFCDIVVVGSLWWLLYWLFTSC